MNCFKQRVHLQTGCDRGNYDITEINLIFFSSNTRKPTFRDSRGYLQNLEMEIMSYNLHSRLHSSF